MKRAMKVLLFLAALVAIVTGVAPRFADSSVPPSGSTSPPVVQGGLEDKSAAGIGPQSGAAAQESESSSADAAPSGPAGDASGAVGGSSANADATDPTDLRAAGVAP